ncbi:MAG: ATP-binding cassette domain-containing protein [Xanthobacteraceae bacterium]|jgi:putative ABC transport system ATP-binding protein
MVILNLHGISKTYLLPDEVVIKAIDNLSLELRRGEFAVIVGANGAGKSTLFDLLAGRTFPDSGRIVLASVDLTHTPPYERARYITLINQARGAGLPRTMTVREVMTLALASATTRGRSKDSELSHERRLDSLETGLSRILDSQIWHLSGGEYQFVALAVAWIKCEGTQAGSHLLLLDEHVSNLAPLARERVLEATTRIVKDNALTAMIASHSLDIATNIGNRQIVLANGRIVADLSGNHRITEPTRLRALLEHSLG